VPVCRMNTIVLVCVPEFFLFFVTPFLSTIYSTLAFPGEIKPCQVFVDRKANTVLVPISGVHVPFHISTIKVRRGSVPVAATSVDQQHPCCTRVSRLCLCRRLDATRVFDVGGFSLTERC
jgi:hypothetical protein